MIEILRINDDELSVALEQVTVLQSKKERMVTALVEKGFTDLTLTEIILQAGQYGI